MENTAASSRSFRWDYLWWLCFAATALFLIWRAPYGYCDNDEGAFLAIPYRLTMGDALLKHEWHPSQVADILLYPLLQLYLLFTNGATEGIILHFRYIEIALKMAVSVYLYFRFKRLDPIAAIFSALFPVLALSIEKQVVSYDANGCLLLLLCISTLITTRKVPRVWEWVFCGVCFACAVLTCPLYMLVWVLFMLLCWMTDKRRRAGQEIKAFPMLSVKGGLIFTGGAAAVALVFCAFVLSRASVGEIIELLPNILSDPDHLQTGLRTQVREFDIALFGVNRKLIRLILALAIAGMLLLRRYRYAGHPERLQKEKFIFLFAYLALVGICVQQYGFPYQFYLIPVSITGVLLYLLVKPTRPSVFWLLYCGGYLFGCIRYFTSNVGVYTLRYYLCISMTAVFLFLFQLLRENKAAVAKLAGKIALGAASVLPVVIMGFVVYCVATTSLWVKDVSTLNTHLSDGPLKGIYVTQERAAYCNALMEETKGVREAKEGPILYFGDGTWLWLAQNLEFGTDSTWMALSPEYNQVGYMEKLEQYYERFPEKRPRYLYVSAVNNIGERCFDPQQFIDRFQLNDAKIQKMEYGCFIDASALQDGQTSTPAT